MNTHPALQHGDCTVGAGIGPPTPLSQAPGSPVPLRQTPALLSQQDTALMDSDSGPGCHGLSHSHRPSRLLSLLDWGGACHGSTGLRLSWHPGGMTSSSEERFSVSSSGSILKHAAINTRGVCRCRGLWGTGSCDRLGISEACLGMSPTGIPLPL